MYDVIIVGSGPGGMTAALYASRAGLKVGIIEKMSPGGQLINTNEIENYPGYTNISGFELAQEMSEHSLQFGAEYLYGNVEHIEKSDGVFTVTTDVGSIKAKYVIVATGTQYKKLNLKNEEFYEGKGISYCAVCDGAFYKDKNVVVVGGGDSAFEEAIYLTKFANEVHLLIRNKARATQKSINDANNNEKITIHYGASPIEYLGDSQLTGLRVKNNNNESKVMDIEGLFPYIGSTPNTQFITFDVLNEHGYINVNSAKETKVPGLYAVGDVTSNPLRQIVVAASDGAIAAQHIVSNLKQ